MFFFFSFVVLIDVIVMGVFCSDFMVLCVVIFMCFSLLVFCVVFLFVCCVCIGEIYSFVVIVMVYKVREVLGNCVVWLLCVVNDMSEFFFVLCCFYCWMFCLWLKLF